MSPKPAPEQTTGPLAEIAAERKRQIDGEGWDRDHDDKHKDGSLARVAALYAGHASAYARLRGDVTLDGYRLTEPPPGWPWLRMWWKPKNPRRDLIVAAALIVAEVERLDRAEARNAT